jgi:hypothetical protein
MEGVDLLTIKELGGGRPSAWFSDTSRQGIGTPRLSGANRKVDPELARESGAE